MKKHQGATILEEIVLNADCYDDAFDECTTSQSLQLNEVLYDIIDDLDDLDDLESAFDAYKAELECRF